MICPFCGAKFKQPIIAKLNLDYDTKYAYIQKFDPITHNRQGMAMKERCCPQCGYVLNSKPLEIKIAGKSFYEEVAKELRNRNIPYMDRIKIIHKAREWWKKHKVKVNFEGLNLKECVEIFITSLNHSDRAGHRI